MEKLSLLQLANNIKDFCKKIDDINSLKNDIYNSNYLKTSDTKIFQMKLPLGLNFHSEKDQNFFFGKKPDDFNCNYPLAEAYITAFSNSKLISKSFILISHDNYVIKDSYFNDQVLYDTGIFMQNSLGINMGNGNVNIPFVLHKDNQEIKFIDQEMILIPYHWHFNYHHWIIECLPKLKYIIDSEDFKNCLIILPKNLNKFQKESMELLQIPESRIFYFDGDPIQVAKIYLPSMGNFSHEDISWLKKSFLKKLNIQTKPEKLIYISRQDAKQRRIINEKEIFEILKISGFEFYTLSDMSFIEQIKLFSQAKIIIGSHGAGLTNIIFSGPEAVLIEIIPNDTVNHCFWLLSNTSGNKYSYLVSDFINTERDIFISPNKLIDFLKKIGIS